MDGKKFVTSEGVLNNPICQPTANVPPAIVIIMLNNS
jgi:hypothetical protein